MTERDALLAAYDNQLRTDGEVSGALSVERHGPLLWAHFPHGRGFVTYRDLEGCSHADLATLVAESVEHFESDSATTTFEWKTRGHDVAPGVEELLTDAGFVAEDPESVMIGRAEALAVEVPIPAEVTLRSVSTYDDILAMTTMQGVVFGDPPEQAVAMADAAMDRLRADTIPGAAMWVAEADGAVISAGRVDPVAGTDFAGIWGGSTLPQWRGRGIYRALTARRAQSAMAVGKTLINSDSTEYSRPILQRYGFVKVTTTTPYVWSRQPA